MRLQCPSIRVRDMNLESDRQETTIGFRNEVLPTNPTGQLAEHDPKRGYTTKDIKKETIIDTTRKRKLWLFGHISRMDEPRLVKHVVFAKMDEKSRRGCPCREWLDDITEWCQLNRQVLSHLAQDRHAWKNLIS